MSAPWELLKKQVQQHRLPHAILLYGEKGIGKFEFAHQFSKFVLCERDQDAACGCCRACALMAAGNHPDFLTITLEEKSRQIKVEQIRAMMQTVQQTAHQKGYQVVLIYPAETMNRAGANALLKTLEEPEGNVLIILIAHQLAGLPATVLSRCQKIAMSGRAALSPEMMAMREQCIQSFLKMQSGEMGPIEAAGEFLKSDILVFLQILLSVWMDCMKLQLNVAAERLQTREDVSLLKPLSAHLSLDVLENLMESTQKALQVYQRSAGINPQLLLENIFLQFDAAVSV